MDLIYMTDTKEDIGVLSDYTLDLAYGTDENDFELTTSINSKLMHPGYIIYIEGTEYGGIIDSIEVDTKNELLIYRGRTWHGILNAKVISPPDGQDYLIVNGELNSIIGLLISEMSLNGLFTAATTDSGITVTNYKIPRYIKGYTALKKLVKLKNCKLLITFKNGMVMLSADKITDYSKIGQIDNDMVNFDITKYYKPINHVICLGAGQLKDRKVLHVYSDADGNYSETEQTFTGLDEVMDVYEDTNAEDDSDLIDGGKQIIQDSRTQNAMDVTFDAINGQYDIGDIVEAKENVTGLTVKEYITKKIVKIEDDTVKITYEVGGVE